MNTYRLSKGQKLPLVGNLLDIQQGYYNRLWPLKQHTMTLS